MRPLPTLLCLGLAACAGPVPHDPAFFSIAPGALPEPDLGLDIPGLGPCTDNPDRRLHLNGNEPVNVMVHGCFGSSGEFRGLAQVLAFHGQQSACFTYDDRAALTDSASALRHALNRLSAETRTPQITLIGHSQGALIARKAVTVPQLAPPPSRQADLRLVTISGPFAGIRAARACGIEWLRPVTLGLMPLSCHLVTGAKWADITYSSPFIRHPGALAPEVSRYLKVDTDERGSCRRAENGRCVEDDEIFSLAEQQNPAVDEDFRIRRIEVRAGHVEIIGDRARAPDKLIAVLQQQGILRPTAPERLSAFWQLLARVYGDTRFTSAPFPQSREKP